MAQLTVNTFIRQLDKEGLKHPYYMLIGNEPFFQDDLLKRIEAKAFKDPAEKDFNFHLFYGTESSVTDIISACMAYPMFADYKLVIVKEFDKLKIDDKEGFTKFIENPQPTSRLIMVGTDTGKTKFDKMLEESSVFVKTRALYENEIFEWIQVRFREEGLESDPDAIAFMVENTGTNLLRLNQELEKVKNFIGSEKRLTLDMISELSGFTRDVNIFALQAALVQRNLQKSMKLSLQLLEQGEAIQGILPALSNFFRRMLVVKQMREHNESKQTIIRELRGNEYAYRDIFANIANFSQGQILSALDQLETAEIMLKTSQKPAESILSMLSYHICTK
jgi:DNA polymerase-3 subunit delta